MDLVLALAEDLVVDFVWSDELLAEWERVIVRDGGRTKASARAVVNAVMTFFASGRIDPSAHRSHIDETPEPDRDDRAHIAASVGGKATVLLTKNVRDFPADYLASHGVRLMTADTFRTDLLRRRPSDVTATVRRLAAEKRRPPRTPCDLVQALGRAGASVFAHRLGRRLGC
jgi:predicted nucleic acid-binding protein